MRKSPFKNLRVIASLLENFTLAKIIASLEPTIIVVVLVRSNRAYKAAGE